MVGPKKQDFWPNINILDGNLGILWIRWMSVHWKLDIMLENKVCPKLKLLENGFNKKCAPKLLFLKKSETFRWFLTKKNYFESQIGALFLQTVFYYVLHINRLHTMISFKYVEFWSKINDISICRILELAPFFDILHKDIYSKKVKNGILLPKLFWPTVRKNCSSDRENFLEFELEGGGREFAIWDH